jgi:hypothetical protein
MITNLQRISQIVSLFLEDVKYSGVKFRDGAKEALIAAAVWAGSDTNKLCDAIDNEFKKWIIPDGLMMPWGKVIPIKAKKA